MMTYEEFKQAVKAELLNYLPQEYGHQEVHIQKITRTNCSLDAVCLIDALEKCITSPKIYVRQLYNKYLRISNFEKTMQSAARIIEDDFRKAVFLSFERFDLDSKKTCFHFRLFKQQQTQPV